MIKGIGTDIVCVCRIDLKIARKVLVGKEVEEYNNTNNKEQYLASRFCVKEAIIKATNKQYQFKDIEILHNVDGSIKTNIDGIYVSLSHEKEYCIAMCVWED